MRCGRPGVHGNTNLLAPHHKNIIWTDLPSLFVRGLAQQQQQYLFVPAMPPAGLSSGTPGGIYTPGSIWQKAVEHKAAAPKQGGRADAHIYFVGASSSGKSTLISRFLYPGKAEPAKPSPGLEYTFARKAAAYDPNRKDIAHIWELAGGEALSAQLTQGSHIFLTHRQVTNAVVVIVLDLSDPASVLSYALHWLGLVRQKLAATYGLFEKRGLAQLPQQLKSRHRNKTFSQQHPDAQLVDCPGVSIVFACTKWDALKDRADPEGLRLLSHALRWLAHSNAAHLVYLGGLQPAGSTAAGSEGVRLLDSFSRLINHLAFVGMDRKIPLKQKPSTDHLGPLLIPAGHDTFSTIGLPHSSSSSSSSWDAASVASGQQQWLDAVGRVWKGSKDVTGPKQQQQQQQQQGGHGSSTVAFSVTYLEDEVDGAYKQREAALEAYMQEQGAEAKRGSRRKTATAVAVPAQQ